MNDNVLADRVVELGVAKRFPDEKEWWIYSLNDIGPNGQIARQFVRDWRVAGALMEKAFTKIEGRPEIRGRIPTLIIEHSYVSVIHAYTKNGEALSASIDNFESLPRAIIEACAEALNE